MLMICKMVKAVAVYNYSEASVMSKIEKSKQSSETHTLLLEKT